MKTAEVLERVPGLTVRRLHHWCNLGFLGEELQHQGTGNQHTFSLEDVMALKQVLRLLDAGLTLAKAWEATNDDAGWETVPGQVERYQLAEGVWVMLG